MFLGDPNYYVVLISKIGISSISRKKLSLTLIIEVFDQKNRFCEEWSWFKFNNLGLVIGIPLNIYSSVG